MNDLINILILEPDDRIYEELSGIFLTGRFLDYGARAMKIGRMNSARQLACDNLDSIPDLVIADFSAAGDPEMEKAADRLKNRFPWMQIVLLFRMDDPDMTDILCRRNDRFILYPFKTENVCCIFRDSLWLAAVKRQKNQEASLNRANPQPENAGKTPFMERLDKNELEILPDLSAVQFAAGYVCMVCDGRKAGGIERAHRFLEQIGFLICSWKQPEGQGVFLMMKKFPEEGLEYGYQQIVDAYVRENVLLYEGGMLQSANELSACWKNAQINFEKGRVTRPQFWGPGLNQMEKNRRWVLTCVIGILSERYDDLPSLCRQQAENLQNLDQESKRQSLLQMKEQLEKQMNITFFQEDKDFRLEQTGMPEILDLQTVEAILVSWMQQAESTGASKSGERPLLYLRRICQCIYSQFKNPDFSLESAAVQLGLSSGYICLLMKKYLPYSFVHYLNQCRIHYAMGLLEHGVHVQEAAARSGFGSSTYFGRVFKKITGITPASYRTLYMQKRQILDAAALTEEKTFDN